MAAWSLLLQRSADYIWSADFKHYNAGKYNFNHEQY